ncbi:DMT family transporter [uncultured Halovibrio sp.]|uniref:DMT family transporter n=1 Tax=uncultured Halovibrio sp. TaxID=985049 RepID=UPI0026002FA1|nr:DMT family transporter [uncultured Halovibrio sp.]
MNDQRQAMILGVTTVLLWSTAATAFKISLEHLSRTGLMFWGVTFSILVLVAWQAWQRRLGETLRPGRKGLLLSLGFGLINPILYYILLFGAYDLLPAQEAMAINYTWALTLTYLAVPFLGHRLKTVDALAGLICYSGVFIIATRGDPLAFDLSNGPGVVLALLSTLVWAFYWIFNTRDTREPVAGLLLNFLVAWPLILVLALWDGWQWPAWQGLAGAAWVGAFEMGIAFVLWLLAMKKATNTSRLSNLIFLSPPLSLGFIALIVGEPILGSTVVGLALVITGLYLQQHVHSRSQ